MSLIKSYVHQIQEMGYDPYNFKKLSSEDWDNLITKVLRIPDKKLYEFLILTRCQIKTEERKRAI